MTAPGAFAGGLFENQNQNYMNAPTYICNIPRGNSEPYRVHYRPSASGFIIEKVMLNRFDLVEDFTHERIYDLFLDHCAAHYESRDIQPGQAINHQSKTA